MIYSDLVLFCCAMGGILLHNLVKLNEINRASDGEINFIKYIKLERFSILISLVVSIVSLMIKSEIKELQIAGNWLGLSFVAIGYMSQSILNKFFSKVDK